MPAMRWTKARFDDEKDEFRRVEKELDLPYDGMRYRYNTTSPVILTKSLWPKLENSDSWKVKNYFHLATLLKAYNKPVENIGFLLDALLVKRVCPLPVGVVYADKDGNQKFALIAGNTRLCVCRIAGIQPRIVILDYLGSSEDP